MIEFQKNKWKHSTIGLAAILAVGFSFPNAFAAASTDSIMAVVKDIQAKLTNTQNGLPAVQTKLNNIQGDVDSLQTQLADLQSSHFKKSFSDTLDHAGDQFTVLEEDEINVTFGALVVVDVSGVIDDDTVRVTCWNDDSGSIKNLENGHHEIPVSCDKISFDIHRGADDVTSTALVSGDVFYDIDAPS